MPDRLELVKGAPSMRRSHLDQLIAALWPARILTRRSYAQSLVQRNALIGRIRAGVLSPEALEPWNSQLAGHGIALMRDRAAATEEISAEFRDACAELGLEGEVQLSYRPRSRASDAAELASELGERTQRDLERGYTGHGPHRDELAILHQGRELRTYGSQGQQRLALLGLLLSERSALGAARACVPLMLLDDVMSELDGGRRSALVELLDRAGGQTVITTTELEQVPRASGYSKVAVSEGRVLQDVLAA